MKGKEYDLKLKELQTRLCHLQDWVKAKGLRVIVVFEGRDAAGKGGTIKAITERVSPRVFRAVALPAPSDREKSQMYIQRYIPHFPAAGEVAIFDRSWYNRAWLEVGKEEQARRFAARIDDPLRQWKLSPMDIESWRRWDDYTQARDEMLMVTDTPHAPWHIVRSDDKKSARLNCISHLLSVIPHERVHKDKVKLPKRPAKEKYDAAAGLAGRKFVPEAY